MEKRFSVMFVVGLLILSTVTYSVVNSAREASIGDENSGGAACSIVQAVCRIGADASFCATAQQRACDAMQPSPFAGLVRSQAHVTFFLMLSLLLAGSVMVVAFVLCRTILKKKIFIPFSLRPHFANRCNASLLAGKFSALRC